MTVLILGLTAAAGAAVRFLVDTAVARRAGTAFPWGILAVNVSGSLALGLVVGLAPPDPVVTLAGAGFLGAYTTFSTLAVDTIRLAEDGALAPAALNVAASLLAGLAAAGAGLLLGAGLAG